MTNASARRLEVPTTIGANSFMNFNLPVSLCFPKFVSGVLRVSLNSGNLRKREHLAASSCCRKSAAGRPPLGRFPLPPNRRQDRQDTTSPAGRARPALGQRAGPLAGAPVLG